MLTDLSLYSTEDLAAAPAELNDRPQKILGRQTQPSSSVSSSQHALTLCEEHWNPPHAQAQSAEQRARVYDQ